MTAPHARLLGIGEHRPERVVTNDDLAATLDTSDQWIRERTGIAARRVAADGETVVTMATDAAGKALAAAGVTPDQVGLVILATCTLPTTLPVGSSQVAHLLGTAQAGAYDVNAACAGFCYALSAAADAVRAGSTTYAVVIGSERMSDVVDWTDRGSAILFGDGAGAVVVGPSDAPGIGPVVWGSDGAKADLIEIPPGGKLGLDGPAVFRWAITSLGDVVRRACDLAGVAPTDLAAVVPHQANLRIVTAVAKAVGAPDAVVADDIVDNGNTSSASIPLALSRLQSQGRVTSGDRALIVGFGAGLTWAGQVVTVP